MRFPFTLLDNLSYEFAKRWHSQFVAPERTNFEGVWRRTQDPKNREKSGWNNDNDTRRKVIHVYDKYNLACIGNQYSLVLQEPYLTLEFWWTSQGQSLL